MTLKEKIISAKTIDDVIHMVKLSGFDYVKSYIDDLNRIMIDDEDDIVHLDSLKNFVLFLLDNKNITPFKVNITPNCFVDARWNAVDYTTTIIMEFLSNNEISFTIADRRNNKREYTSGRGTHETIINKIESILQTDNLFS